MAMSAIPVWDWEAHTPVTPRDRGRKWSHQNCKSHCINCIFISAFLNDPLKCLAFTSFLHKILGKHPQRFLPRYPPRRSDANPKVRNESFESILWRNISGLTVSTCDSSLSGNPQCDVDREHRNLLSIAP